VKATITIEDNEQTGEVDITGECSSPEDGHFTGVHLVFLYLAKNMHKVVADASAWVVSDDSSREA
jgi:hypothetical protein